MSPFSKPIYTRILLKLSGEALLGQSQSFIDPAVLLRIADEIASLLKAGVQVGVVIGGGNLFRGAALTNIGIDRITGDQMGMLGTVINGLVLRDALERINIHTRILSSVAVQGVADPFDRLKAIHFLEKNNVVIFTGGTGNPIFTTDTAASLRGIEIQADALLKATKVDGVYSADPVKDKTAQMYKELTYREVVSKDLRVMDLSAISLCREQNLPIHVFNLNKPKAMLDVVMGKKEGTVIKS